MKTYNTHNARNAVKVAQVTNYIKAAKKRAGPKYLQDPLFQTPGVPKVVSTGKKP